MSAISVNCIFNHPLLLMRHQSQTLCLCCEISIKSSLKLHHVSLTCSGSGVCEEAPPTPLCRNQTVRAVGRFTLSPRGRLTLKPGVNPIFLQLHHQLHILSASRKQSEWFCLTGSIFQSGSLRRLVGTLCNTRKYLGCLIPSRVIFCRADTRRQFCLLFTHQGFISLFKTHETRPQRLCNSHFHSDVTAFSTSNNDTSQSSKPPRVQHCLCNQSFTLCNLFYN